MNKNTIISILGKQQVTPMTQNLINMINNNDLQGIENLARNICKERGIDPDEMYNNVKQSYNK